MSFKTRALSVLAVLVLLAVILGVAASGATVTERSDGSIFNRKTTLHLWYNDESLTDYLNEVAVSYNESQDEYRVEPVLQSGVEYLEEINRVSVADENLPDLYIVSNDSLAKASLAGLTSQVQDQENFDGSGVFPQAAIDAVTYDGQIVAYPFYFETAAFLYNETYLQTMADTAGVSLEEAVPETLMDVLQLANSFDAPEGVESVFRWDVDDIFYNYYIVGNYLNVGGAAGDDASQLDIYNTDAIRCMQVYQQLNQFFSIDTDTVNYSGVLDDFANGRIAFTVATSDAAAVMREAQADGRADFEYGVTRMPDVTDELQSKSMSVTQCLVVNGYSQEQDEANRFIQYMIYEHNDDFYDRTGKALAQSGYSYSDPHMDGFYEAYVDSVPLTKMREASNFWVLLENAFSEIWNGADAGETLRSLYEQMVVQLTGEEFTAQEIPEPEPVDINSMLTGGE
ncbi:MAG: extracellular solute-binding protein [Eubacteriales bacterium]|nr:extracellular solute-binding protein [Eubacteriales bacterium]